MDKAVEHLRAALTLDCNGKFAVALNAYLAGVPLLLEAAKDPSLSVFVQDFFKAKCKQYLSRIQTIRDCMEKSEEVPHNNYIDKHQSSWLQLEDSNKDAFSYYSEVPSPLVALYNFAGHPECKDFIEKNVILPLRFPGVLDRVTRVKRGILLYGLPGIGKTYLIQAILSSVSCPYLCIPSSDLVSRVYSTEQILKHIQNIFEWARKNQPCLLCFEDLDVLCHPDHNKPESTSSQAREELTSQLQGYSADNQVTVIGSTQTPWYLTGKLVRKFDRRFMLTLPELEDRIAIFKHHLSDVKHGLTEDDFRKVGERTCRFTGADLVCLARDVAMQTVRHIQDATHYKKIIVDKTDSKEAQEEMLTPCAPDEPGALEITWEFLNADKLYVPPATIADVDKCLMRCLPSCSEDEVVKMAKWGEEFGQVD